LRGSKPLYFVVGRIFLFEGSIGKEMAAHPGLPMGAAPRLTYCVQDLLVGSADRDVGGTMCSFGVKFFTDGF
jgi:hypothetical protein